jgi:hypothetical protein
MTKAQQAYIQMLIQAVLDGHITQRQAKRLHNRFVSTPFFDLDDK